MPGRPRERSTKSPVAGFLEDHPHSLFHGDETVTDFTASNAPNAQALTNILISVKAVWLSGHDPWDFEFMGESFSARIYDSEFLARVENREFAFGHGDLLRVNALLTMNTKRTKRNWSIVKVWDHISATKDPDPF